MRYSSEMALSGLVLCVALQAFAAPPVAAAPPGDAPVRSELSPIDLYLRARCASDLRLALPDGPCPAAAPPAPAPEVRYRIVSRGQEQVLGKVRDVVVVELKGPNASDLVTLSFAKGVGKFKQVDARTNTTWDLKSYRLAHQLALEP